MATYQCPFCKIVMAVNPDTQFFYNMAFKHIDPHFYNMQDDPYAIRIVFYRCPNCEKVSIAVSGISAELEDLHVNIYPPESKMRCPEYVPEHIRQDYEEATAIFELSPRASSALFRRCLQEMIRDFWGIHSLTLNEEINRLKDKLHPTLWNAIHALRNVGNIGAHMDQDASLIVDIDPDEARKLKKLVDVLMRDWYDAREGQKSLYNEITAVKTDKKFKKPRPLRFLSRP